jgi:hypothetical protein
VTVERFAEISASGTTKRVLILFREPLNRLIESRGISIMLFVRNEQQSKQRVKEL